MMSTIGSQPVMWVNVKSLLTSGPYAAANMRSWDAALLDACKTYPNMRIFDWASVVRKDWFIPDGIHFTTPGYSARSRLIADALRLSFPASAPRALTARANCLVHPPPDPVPPSAPSTTGPTPTTTS